MTVQALAGIINKGWEGFEAIQLPIGAWQASGSVTGDVSGGTREFLVIFRTTGDPVSAMAYSLEDLSVQDTDVSTKQLNVSTSGFKLLKQRRMTIGTPSGGNVASLLNLWDVLPLFMGQLQGISGAQLRISTSNVNLDDLIVSAEGYMWDARTILAPGGYLRPTNSAFGR